jgi:hypothetical protein
VETPPLPAAPVWPGEPPDPLLQATAVATIPTSNHRQDRVVFTCVSFASSCDVKPAAPKAYQRTLVPATVGSRLDLVFQAQGNLPLSEL